MERFQCSPKGLFYQTHAGFDKPQLYVKEEPYLYFPREDRIERAKTWRKKVIDQMGGDREFLLKFIKKERLNILNPSDLAKLVQYNKSSQ